MVAACVGIWLHVYVRPRCWCSTAHQQVTTLSIPPSPQRPGECWVQWRPTFCLQQQHTSSQRSFWMRSTTIGSCLSRSTAQAPGAKAGRGEGVRRQGQAGRGEGVRRQERPGSQSQGTRCWLVARWNSDGIAKQSGTVAVSLSANPADPQPGRWCAACAHVAMDKPLFIAGWACGGCTHLL